MSDKKKLIVIPRDPGHSRSVETVRAHGVAVNGQMAWLPKSQIEEFTEDHEGVSFWCPEWLIVEKGLDMFVDTSHEPTLF